MENKSPRRPRPVIINGPRPKVVGVKPSAPKPAAAAPKPVKEEPKATVVATPVPAPTPVQAAPSPQPKPAETLSSSATTTASVAPAAVAEEPKVAAQTPVQPQSQAVQEEKKVVSKTKTDPRKSKPEPKKPKAEKSGGGGKGVLIVLVLLLACSTGYLLYDKFDKEQFFTGQLEEAEQNAEKFKSDIDMKLAEINRLQDSLRVVISEKEKLGEELSVERAKLAELEGLKGQLKAKQRSLNAMSRKLSRIQNDHQTQQASIGALVAENQRLVSEKVKLQQAIVAKDDSLKMIAATQVALASKVAKASVVKAENINISVFNTGGKEMKGSYKAMLVGKVKLSVKLGKNEITEHGKKTVYMRFIEPSGNTLYEGDKSFTLNGKKVSYTDKTTIDFNNTGQTVGFFYAKGSRYIPGKYTVEFYMDGEKIGDNTVIFKR